MQVPSVNASFSNSSGFRSVQGLELHEEYPSNAIIADSKNDFLFIFLKVGFGLAVVKIQVSLKRGKNQLHSYRINTHL